MKLTTVLGMVMACTAAVAGAAPPSETVLRVDGIDISRPEFELAKAAAQEQAKGQQLEPAVAVRHAVDQLVGRALLVEAARQAGINVTDAQVQAGLEQQRARVGGAEALAKLGTSFGFTEADLIVMERARLLVGRYVQEQLAPKLVPTEDQIQAYFKGHPDDFKHPEQLRVRVILKQVTAAQGEEGWTAAKAAVEAAAKRIAAGEDFAKVAAEVSDDPSKAEGGDLGWVYKGLLLPELDAAAFALKPGQVSPVVRSQIGYHLIKVEEQRGPGSYSLDEVKPRLKEFLTQREIGGAVAKLIAERRPTAKIEALDPAIRQVLSGAEKTTPSAPRPDDGAKRP
ncbi:MAG: peptidylprolyl isomerase [Acidobacteriota bacterium]